MSVSGRPPFPAEARRLAFHPGGHGGAFGQTQAGAGEQIVATTPAAPETVSTARLLATAEATRPG